MNKPYATEAPIRRVAPLLILLLAAIVSTLAAIAALSHLWQGDTRPISAQTSIRTGASILETAPQPALRSYLAQKQRIATRYSWIDPTRHLARIPIDEAMHAMILARQRSPEHGPAYLMGAKASISDHAGKQAARAALPSSADDHARERTP